MIYLWLMKAAKREREKSKILATKIPLSRTKNILDGPYINEILISNFERQHFETSYKLIFHKQIFDKLIFERHIWQTDISCSGYCLLEPFNYVAIWNLPIRNFILANLFLCDMQ